MSYLDLLKLASPEAIIVLTALIILAIGLTNGKTSPISSSIAIVGIVAAIFAVCMLPAKTTFLAGMLVITPLTSFFKIVSLGLTLIAVLLAQKMRPHHSEFLAMLLLATVGLMF